MALEQWKQARNRNGVLVETRGNPRFGLLEFRATAIAPAEPEAVVARIRDPDSFHEWYAELRESRLVEAAADGRSWLQYLAVKQPFPVSDRDVFVRLKLRQRGNATSIAIQAEQGDPVRGLVRMPYLRGFWWLAPTDGGTRVIHQVQAEAGGDVPAFVANAAVTNGPFDTLRGLRRLFS